MHTHLQHAHEQYFYEHTTAHERKEIGNMRLWLHGAIVIQCVILLAAAL